MRKLEQIPAAVQEPRLVSEQTPALAPEAVPAPAPVVPSVAACEASVAQPPMPRIRPTMPATTPHSRMRPAGTTGSASSSARAVGGLAAAFIGEQGREDDEMGRVSALEEAGAARVEALTAELRQVHLEQEQQRQEQGRLRALAGSPSRAGSSAALRAGNARIAEECEELRMQLALVRDESLRLESACPALEDAAESERYECARLHRELNVERGCAERAEHEAAAMHCEVEEAERRAEDLRSQLGLAEKRNAELEEECAEAASESRRARSSVATARQRLESRTSQLVMLRGVVREHARKLGESVSMLEESLLEVPSPSGSLGIDGVAVADAEMGDGAAAAGEFASAPRLCHGPGADVPTAALGVASTGRAGLAVEGEAWLQPPCGCPPGGAEAVVEPAAEEDGAEEKVPPAAVHPASSADDGTPTQDADIAAGVAIGASAGAAAGMSAHSGSSGTEPVEREQPPGPLAKRRRLPATSKALQPGITVHESGRDGLP